MWLLNAHTHTIELFPGTNPHRYAILSHRWEDDEVTFKDIQKRRHRTRAGWQKVELCCTQAISDGLSYVWIDTCCIDKRSSSELAEAINSMYRWYHDAAVCYAFLSDVTVLDKEASSITEASEDDGSVPKTSLDTPISQSLWFSRGWTLQELLAPQNLEFYSRGWVPLGSKVNRWSDICDRTSIPHAALQNFEPSDYSVAQRMSWAAGRNTTRIEDRAYSLLGIFNIHMPLMYGEGSHAFIRLQEEIMKVSTDTSVFAWSGTPDASFGMLTTSPDCYSDFKNIQDFEPWKNPYFRFNIGISASFITCKYMDNILVAGLAFSKDSIDRIETSPLESGDTFIGIFLTSIEDGDYARASLDGETLFVGKWSDSHETKATVMDVGISQEPMVEIQSSHVVSPKDVQSFLEEKKINQIDIKPGVFRNQGTADQIDAILKSLGEDDLDFTVNEDDTAPCPCLVIMDKTRKDSRPIILRLEVNEKGDLSARFLDQVEPIFCPHSYSTSPCSHICTRQGCVIVDSGHFDLITQSPDRSERQLLRNLSRIYSTTQPRSIMSAAEIRHLAERIITVQDIGTLYVVEDHGRRQVWFDFDSNVSGTDRLPWNWQLPDDSVDEFDAPEHSSTSYNVVEHVPRPLSPRNTSYLDAATDGSVSENESTSGTSLCQIIVHPPSPPRPGIESGAPSDISLMLSSLQTAEDLASSHFDGNPHINDEFGMDNEHLRWLASRSVSDDDSCLLQDGDFDTASSDCSLPPYTPKATESCFAVSDASHRIADASSAPEQFIQCPVCHTLQSSENTAFNEHVDSCLNGDLVAMAVADNAALSLSKWLQRLDEVEPSEPVSRIEVVDDLLASTTAGLVSIYNMSASEAEMNMQVCNLLGEHYAPSISDAGSLTSYEESDLVEVTEPRTLVTAITIEPDEDTNTVSSEAASERASLPYLDASSSVSADVDESLDDPVLDEVVLLLKRLSINDSVTDTQRKVLP